MPPVAHAPNLKRGDSSPERKGTGAASFADVGRGWAAFTHSLGRSLPTSLLRAGQYERAARLNLARPRKKR